MSTHPSYQGSETGRTWRTAAVAVALVLGLAACTPPGAIAPSTMPVFGKKLVELSGSEEATSCGNVLFLVPIGNPKPVAQLIDDMIKEKGGDALIEVTSSSSTFFALLYTRNCVSVRGKVVKFTQ